MVDVVFNHVGYIPNGNNYKEISPFSEESDYHKWCEISDEDFNTNNQHNIEYCRIAGLPDLDTENPEVIKRLNSWIKEFIIEKFGFDGIRIDTVKHVNKNFWIQLRP